MSEITPEQAVVEKGSEKVSTPSPTPVLESIVQESAPLEVIQEEEDVKIKLGAIPAIKEKDVPFVGLFMASMVALIEALVTVEEDNMYWAYAVAVGGVGMSLSLFGVVVSRWRAMDLKVGRWNHNILWLWCFLAACILTFGRGPFVETGNGYFGTWGMVIFSTQGVGISLRQLKESSYDSSSLLGLGIAAVIVVIAVAVALVEDNVTHKANLIYSLILALLTLIFVERLRDFSSLQKSACLAVGAVAWVVAACLLTFDGPFKTTGNGYFSSWVASLMCLYGTNDEAYEFTKDYIKSMIPTADDVDEEEGNTKNAGSAPAGARGIESTSTIGEESKGGIFYSAMNPSGPYYEDQSNDEEFRIEMDLPGVDEEDLDIDLDGDKLKVSGKRIGKDDASVKTVAKDIVVDLTSVDTEKLDAKLKSGVLTLTAPKKPSSKKISLSK